MNLVATAGGTTARWRAGGSYIRFRVLEVQ
jgi:hypothetical protein